MNFFPSRHYRRVGITCAMILLLVCNLARFNVAAAEKFYLQSRETFLNDEQGSVTIWTLHSAKGTHSFTAPLGWSVNWNTERKLIALASTDLKTHLTMSFSNGVPLDEPTKLREQVLARYSKAKIIEEFKCYSASGEGRAFDLGLPDGKVVRLAFIPARTAIFELTLTSPAEDFDLARHSLSVVLNTLQPSR